MRPGRGSCVQSQDVAHDNPPYDESRLLIQDDIFVPDYCRRFIIFVSISRSNLKSRNNRKKKYGPEIIPSLISSSSWVLYSVQDLCTSVM